MTATAADSDGTISKVEFYNGATLLGSDTTSPYSWALTSVAAGSYSYTAKAYDNVGAITTSAAVSIIVNALLPDIEARKTVLVGFKIGDLTAPQAFTYAKGAKAGENGLCQKARRLKIDWVKVDGQHVALPQRMEAEGSVPEGEDDSAPEDQSSADVPQTRTRSARKVA